jgi:tetratricopeptide (TPR) repeat protein
VVEEEKAEAPIAATQLPGDFWLQTADDDGGEPLPADYFERAVQPAPAPPPPKTPPRKAETPARMIEAAAPAAPSVPPPPPIGAEELQSRLEADPADHEARLGLARVWWASGDREQSLGLYQQLVEDETFVSEVAGDLQRDLETFEHPDWYRVLGDAYMKLGNLAQALDAYRQALTHL